MDVVVRTGADEAELTVVRVGQALTVGDLLAAGTGRAAPLVAFVDGRPLPARTPLASAGLADGCVLDVQPPALDEPAARIELDVLAGPGTGRRRRLPAGRFLVGAATTGDGAQLADGTVAVAALAIDVSADGGVVVVAGDGVHLDGVPCRVPTAWPPAAVVTHGGRALTHRPMADPVPPRPPGRRTVHGAPPAAPATTQPPLALPAARRATDGARRFPLLAMLAPVPVAVGLAAVVGEWRFLLFGLLSPVMMLASWADERRSRRHDRRRATRAERAALERLRTAAAARWGSDLAAARRAHHSVADVAALAVAARGLWRARDGPIPIATADVPWSPTVATPPQSLPGAVDVLTACGPLPAVPVVADLADGGVAIVGDAVAARAAARGVLLVAVGRRGPAELAVVVCASTAWAGEWEWTKWLPHVRAGPGLLVSTPAALRAWVDEDDAAAAPATLVVADGDEWWQGGERVMPRLLQRPGVGVLAIVADGTGVPPQCATVVDVTAAGTATITSAVDAVSATEARAPLVEVAVATATARAMSGLDDTARPAAGADLPARCSLLALLGVDTPSAAELRARWARAPGGLRALLGVGEGGRPFAVDLVADGPHGLVAGTTGAGKSELLRTVVAALAATYAPDELTFALIDYKGGAAFDACARLPHTVAVVTDLDDHLAGRVLRSLRAELVHRERVLRDAGAATIDELRRSDPRVTLPRLLVTVDELAALTVELPAFVPALVDIAQRGRSLGLHLLLATQRPAGVVDAKIRANTNLRVALRVQDEADAVDVVGTAAAARLPRRTPGRALVRLGAGEVTAVQTAWSSGPWRPPRLDGFEVRPFVVLRSPTAAEQRWRSVTAPDDDESERSDLDRLVDAAIVAAADRPPPRRPHLEPLPARLELAALLAANDDPAPGIPFAIADRPDEQRQDVRRWRPGADGSLLLVGVAGSGTSSTLATLLVGLAHRASPDDAHVFVIDADANLLSPLDALPHVGAVVPLADTGRVARLARHLGRELARRRRAAAELGSPAAVAVAVPSVVVVVDNVGALREAAERDAQLAEAWATIERLVRDGRPLGVCALLSAGHERALPISLAAAVPARLVLRLGDRHSYAAFGLRPADVPEMSPGRAVDPDGAVELQLAAPPSDLAVAAAEAAAAWPATGRRRPTRVDALPTRLTLAPLLTAAAADDDGWSLPLGLDLRDGGVALAELTSGSTFVVIGPPRSGRTTVLDTLATAAAAVDPDLAVFAVAPGSVPVPGAVARAPSGPADVATWVDRLLALSGRRLVLVDDADELGGPSFERLAAGRSRTLTFVLAGTPDGLRSVTHWSRPLLRTRAGVLLRPVPADGELLRVALPTRLPPSEPGHGLLVRDGTVTPVLLAHREVAA